MSHGFRGNDSKDIMSRSFVEIIRALINQCIYVDPHVKHNHGAKSTNNLPAINVHRALVKGAEQHQHGPAATLDTLNAVFGFPTSEGSNK